MSLYPAEVLDYPVMHIADIIGYDLDDTLFTNDASQTHGLHALALALAWRLQSYPMTERSILHAGLSQLIQINALELGEGPDRDLISPAHEAQRCSRWHQRAGPMGGTLAILSLRLPKGTIWTDK